MGLAPRSEVRAEGWLRPPERSGVQHQPRASPPPARTVHGALRAGWPGQCVPLDLPRTFPPGQYRVVKKVGRGAWAGRFTIGDVPGEFAPSPEVRLFVGAGLGVALFE